MFAIQYIGCSRTDQDIDQVVHAEAFTDANDARHDLLCDNLRVRYIVGIPETNIAGSAVIGLVRLAEVFDQRAVAAFRGPAVVGHLFELLLGCGDNLARGTGFDQTRFGDLAQGDPIPCGEEQHAFRRQSIAARAARLLLIMFDRFGHRRVGNKPHVWPIDPHAECDGGDDHVHLFVDECILSLLPLVVRHACMIADDGETLASKIGSDRFDIRAAKAIDNPT